MMGERTQRAAPRLEKAVLGSRPRLEPQPEEVSGPLPDRARAIQKVLCSHSPDSGVDANELSRALHTAGVEMGSDNVRQVIRRYRKQLGVQRVATVGYFIPMDRRPNPIQGQ